MRPWILAWAACAAASCGNPSGPGTLEARTVSRASAPVLPGATSEQRFGRSNAPSGMGGTSAPAAGAAAPSYTLPEGWEILDPSSARLIHLRPAGEPEAVCYVSFLPTGPDQVADNVDRWRKQLGLAPLDAAGHAALERRPFFSGDAVIVDLSGTFTGMGGAEAPQQNWGMLGAIAATDRGSWFVKFLGPRPVLDHERAHFLEFLDSMRAGMPQDHNHAGMTGGSAPGGGALGGGGDMAPGATIGGFASHDGLSWQAPDGWQDQGQRPMRAVSYQVGQGTECYISVLTGDGGGLVGNLDRWSGQLGGEPVTPARLDTLPRIAVLGVECPLLEVQGSYRSMSGQVEQGYTLLGTACIRPGKSVFVKMIGPAAEVAAARGDFEAFCRSLEDAR